MFHGLDHLEDGRGILPGLREAEPSRCVVDVVCMVRPHIVVAVVALGRG